MYLTIKQIGSTYIYLVKVVVVVNKLNITLLRSGFYFYSRDLKFNSIFFQ